MARTLYNVIERPRKTSLVAWIQNPPLSLYCFVLRSANTLRHRSLGLNLACDTSRAGKVADIGLCNLFRKDPIQVSFFFFLTVALFFLYLTRLS